MKINAKSLAIGAAKSVTVWLGFAIFVWPMIQDDAEPILLSIFGADFGGLLIQILGLAVIFNRFRTTQPVEEKNTPAPKPEPEPVYAPPVAPPISLVPEAKKPAQKPADKLLAWLMQRESDTRKVAYMMATVEWETARTFRPIKEYGRGKGRKYGAIDATGKAPYGRGYVQLTWRENYVTADKKLGLRGALAADYDLALQDHIARRILLDGMREGWFTGRKLSDYINAYKCDYVGARRIINGTDKAREIALMAEKWEERIS